MMPMGESVSPHSCARGRLGRTVAILRLRLSIMATRTAGSVETRPHSLRSLPVTRFMAPGVPGTAHGEMPSSVIS